MPILARAPQKRNSGVAGSPSGQRHIDSRSCMRVTHLNRGAAISPGAAVTAGALGGCSRADDFVVVCKTRQEAEAALALADRFLRETLGISLHPEKVPANGRAGPGWDGATCRGAMRRSGLRWRGVPAPLTSLRTSSSRLALPSTELQLTS